LLFCFCFSSRRRHTRSKRDWSSDVCSSDLLGRTTKQLIELSQYLEEQGIDLEIIDMNINTKDAMGKMFFTMMSAFAELEANLLSERTKKGLASASSRGRMGGRPKFPKDKRETVISLYESKKYTIK